MRIEQENKDSAQLSNCSSGRMNKTMKAGATDAQLETLGELLLLEANYLQDSCDYQISVKYFLQAAVFFLCRFPKFIFSDKMCLSLVEEWQHILCGGFSRLNLSGSRFCSLPLPSVYTTDILPHTLWCRLLGGRHNCYI